MPHTEHGVVPSSESLPSSSDSSSSVVRLGGRPRRLRLINGAAVAVVEAAADDEDDADAGDTSGDGFSFFGGRPRRLVGTTATDDTEFGTVTP